MWGEPEQSRPWRVDRGGDLARDILEHGVDAAACCASTTRPTRWTPRRCWRRSSASCPRRRAAARERAGDRDELTEHGFVLRYKTDETDDGLSGKEGTFLICSFWLVSALRDRSASCRRRAT
jgi:hypothetical protein